MADGKRKKHRTGRFLVVLLLIAAVAFFVFYMVRSKVGRSGKTGQADTFSVSSDSTALVTRETIRQTTEGNGTLEAASEEMVTAEYSLRIETVDAEEGDYVSTGDVIAHFDPDSIEEQIALAKADLEEADASLSAAARSGSSSLTSPISGRIRRIFAAEDEMLSDVTDRDGGVMEIAAAGQLKVCFEPQMEVETGMDAVIRFSNNDEEYEAQGIIKEQEDGVATAVFDDNAAYDVDVEARVYDLAGHFLGTGTILSWHPYLVEGTYGRVESISVSIGDWVDSGSTLLTRSEVANNADYLQLLTDREEIIARLMELRELKKMPLLTAKENGILSSLALQEGGMAEEGTVMYTLMHIDRYLLKIQVDELDIDGVQPGQDAVVVFDAFDDREYPGTVARVSPLGQNTNGVTTYTVTIEMDGADEFKSAMSATATIITGESQDALVIPVDAIQTSDGKKIVTVLNNNDLSQSEDREVTLGLVNNTSAQVLDGLDEGESVLVVGSTQVEDMMSLFRSSRSHGNGGGRSER